jgi:phage recombination protein Bet
MELTMNALTKAEGNKLALIRRTVARDCDDDEFRLFVHMCEAVRLDPLRRQAHAFVFNKKDPAKRQLTIVTTIGGYRSIAARTGDYRPDDRAPRYTMCEANPDTNPLGIESCEVTVYKYTHGEWFPVVGQAFWTEYAPIVVSAADDDVTWEDTGETWPDSGKPKKKKVIRKGAEVKEMIDPGKQGWVKMPRIMIAKCAEAAALRKAWPDDFANVHAEEETHREESLDAVEAIEMAAREDRIARIGGPDTYLTDWLNGGHLEAVRGGEYADRVMAFLKEHADQPVAIRAWQDRNRHGFNQFWAVRKGEALELKKAIEAVK